MALQNDSGEWTITTPETAYEAHSWNDTFTTAPSGVVVFNTTLVKQKSGILNGTTSTIGASAMAEFAVADPVVAYLAKEPGYSPSASTHPEFDSGEHDIGTTKVLESVSFHSTFSSTPIVVTGYQGNDETWKGGKTSAANITTTGCDVAGEIQNTVDLVNWFAVYTNGFWEGA